MRPGDRPLLLTNASLDVRVPFLVFELVANILLGHLQLLEVTPQLIKHVERHHRRQPQHHQKTAEQDHLQRVAQRIERLLGHQMQHRRPVVPQIEAGHPTDQRRFQDPFQQLGQHLGRKDALQPG